MNMNHRYGMAGIAVVLLTSFATIPQAQAATVVFGYTASSGSPFNAIGQFITSNTLNAAGGYSVINIFGSVDGIPITGLVPNPAQPFASTSADGRIIFDNNVFSGMPHVSNPGIYFSLASGFLANFFSLDATTYEILLVNPGVGYGDSSTGRATFNQLPIPEPATWALMLLGFGAIGLTARTTRRTAFA
jgi:hypothetical protein